jgi:urea transport system substrate-binding protein
MLQTYGGRAYCIGSNYIWAWENNRIMREIARGCGGTVLAEKYLPVGSIDVDQIVQDVLALRPSFVFSSLIGVSSYAFMESFHRAKQALGRASADIPMCSSTLSEPELLKISPAAATGHIASSVYFQSRESPVNEKFVSAYTAGYGAGRVTSADAEAAYNAVHLMANAIQKAGTADIEAVKAALSAVEIEAPQGKVWVDQDNNHCFLTPSLGMSNASGGFDIVWSAEGPVKPDPYLVNFDAREFKKNVSRKTWGIRTLDGAHLRVVK